MRQRRCFGEGHVAALRGFWLIGAVAIGTLAHKQVYPLDKLSNLRRGARIGDQSNAQAAPRRTEHLVRSDSALIPGDRLALLQHLPQRDGYAQRTGTLWHEAR